MDLQTVSKKLGRMDKSKAQFYISQLILAVEYLHSLDIIYRDLKPANTMVDETGYLRLVDMGTAKFMNENRSKILRTYTVIGTPQFMAPEIISGKGYSKPVDLWSIGVTMYKFLTGNYPFGNNCEDPQQIFEDILKKPLQFPGSLRDSAGMAFMKQLLNKTPEVRLGESFAKLKTHAWFDQFDWDRILEKDYTPPYIPEGESILSSDEIKKRETEARPIITHLKSEPIPQITKTPRKPKNPTWDEIF